MYIDKTNNIDDEYRDSQHRTMNMKPFDVKSNKYIDFGVEQNNDDAP